MKKFWFYLSQPTIFIAIAGLVLLFLVSIEYLVIVAWLNLTPTPPISPTATPTFTVTPQMIEEAPSASRSLTLTPPPDVATDQSVIATLVAEGISATKTAEVEKWTPTVTRTPVRATYPHRPLIPAGPLPPSTPTATRSPTRTPKPPTATRTPTKAPTITLTPTANIGADPAVYDNFNNPAKEEKFNHSKWEIVGNTEGVCNVVQRNGELVVSANTSAQVEGDCILSPYAYSIRGSRLQLFEVRVRVDDFSGNSVSAFMVMFSHNLSDNGGWVECGLQAYPDGANAYAYLSGKQSEEFGPNYPAGKERWHTFRYEVDPDTMTVSCLIDYNLVGSLTLEGASDLQDAFFSRYLQFHFAPNSSATIRLDDVKIVPLR